MRAMSRRVAAVVTTGALLAGLTGCGDDGDSSSPAPEVSAVAAKPDLGLAITPQEYANPFLGAVEAAGTAPAVAELLARGMVRAGARTGDPDSAAAGLAATLTSLLTTNVYAVGTLATTIFATAPTGKKAAAARAALDAHSNRVVRFMAAREAEALAPAAGGRGNARLVIDPLPGGEEEQPPPTVAPTQPPPAAGTKPKSPTKSPKPSPTATEPPFDLDTYNFAKAWRGHLDLLVDYAIAAKESNDGDRRSARSALDAWRQGAGQYFRAISGQQLSSYTVRTDLGRYVSALTAALDALASKGQDGYAALRDAAEESPEVVSRLATGLAAGTGRNGSVDDAAGLRAKLTATMTGHAYLAALSYLEAFNNGRNGLVSTPYRVVQVSLDDTAKRLAAFVRLVSGPQEEAEFLQGWRIQIRQLENYARGLDAGMLAERRTAMTELAAYLGTVSQFLAEVTDRKIPPAVLEKRLRIQLAAITGVVDAMHSTFRAA